MSYENIISERSKPRAGWYRCEGGKTHRTDERGSALLCGSQAEKLSKVNGFRSWPRWPPKGYCTDCWYAARVAAIASPEQDALMRSAKDTMPDIPGQSFLWRE